MKAIILSAGQGRRLLPLTATAPKCALMIHGRSVLEWQIETLRECGVDHVRVVVGFGADQIERLLEERFPDRHVTTIFNPFFSMTDNLVSCWLARRHMTEDFLLLNGDTIFEPDILSHVLHTTVRPITVATDHKSEYDADDMKVRLDGERLIKIGKDIACDEADGESMGMLLFRGEGPLMFCHALERAMRLPESLKRWYLSVIGQLAESGLVWTTSIQGRRWAEIDCPSDLEHAKALMATWKNVAVRHHGYRHPNQVQA